ncbi:hypothetical protein [Nocardioides sp.]|uniref:hypothetical protein n=1 Tax=Nocardioides sp. TaxID=35761 RepID=UPI003D0CF272
MTNLGVPSAPTPPDDRAEPEVPLGLLLIAVAVMLVLVAATGFMLTRGDATQAKPAYPDHWDSRILPLVKATERERGLLFLHPVEVRFLAPTAFEKDLRTDEEDLSDDDRAEIEQVTGMVRALGLVTGKLDLFEAVNDFSGAGTLAYYSFDDQRITVRGKKITPGVRSTLVHELTHALQDQHFDVGDRMEKFRDASEDEPSLDASESVLDALIEGDARRVEGLYRASLTKKQRKALDASSQGEAARAGKRITKVPQVIVTMMTSPYTLGQALVETAAADDGTRAVNDLFRDTPTQETSLLDPFSVLIEQPDAVEVAIPKLEDGEKEFDSGQLGVVTWYLMLAERLPLDEALAAADGWGGDAYLSYEVDGTSCARMTYVGATRRDTARMYDALDRWAGAGSRADAKVSRTGNRLRFQSCDPGEKSTIGKDVSQKAVTRAVTRTYLGVGMLNNGFSHDQARCVAGRMIDVFRVEQLQDPKFLLEDPAAEARTQDIVRSCG